MTKLTFFPTYLWGTKGKWNLQLPGTLKVHGKELAMLQIKKKIRKLEKY